MTQNWGPPNYPPRPPQNQPQPPRYPQQSQYPLLDPEADYYYEQPQGDPPTKRIGFFLAGSCFMLLLVACCVAMLAVAWVVDARLGLTTPDEATIEMPAQQMQPLSEATVPVQPQLQPMQPLSDAPVPVQPQLPPEQPVQPEPAAPASEFVTIGQPVIATDVGIALTVFDIQRNVIAVNMEPASGMEFVSVAVQLEGIQPTEFAKVFELANFQLLNGQSVYYLPDAQADNGRRLPNGGELIDALVEGDVLFHIPAGDTPLFLVWQATGSAEIYTIALQ